MLEDSKIGSSIETQSASVFSRKDGVEFSGSLLLIDHCHKFSDSGGLLAVAVLAESHITVHTWSECGYAAFDVFMCGTRKPLNVIDVLNDAFKPVELKYKEVLRSRRDGLSGNVCLLFVLYRLM